MRVLGIHPRAVFVCRKEGMASFEAFLVESSRDFKIDGFMYEYFHGGWDVAFCFVPGAVMIFDICGTSNKYSHRRGTLSLLFVQAEERTITT